MPSPRPVGARSVMRLSNRSGAPGESDEARVSRRGSTVGSWCPVGHTHGMAGDRSGPVPVGTRRLCRPVPCRGAARHARVSLVGATRASPGRADRRGNRVRFPALRAGGSGTPDPYRCYGGQSVAGGRWVGGRRQRTTPRRRDAARPLGHGRVARSPLGRGVPGPRFCVGARRASPGRADRRGNDPRFGSLPSGPGGSGMRDSPGRARPTPTGG